MIEILPGIFAEQIPPDTDPDEWILVNVDGRIYLNGMTGDGTMYAGTNPLPSGSYEILFTTKDCTEEQAEQIVECTQPKVRGAKVQMAFFKNYGKQHSSFGDAIPSLQSLLRSHGLDPDKNYLLLTLKK